jgi:apolipoprotein N-acyltransferase
VKPCAPSGDSEESAAVTQHVGKRLVVSLSLSCLSGALLVLSFPPLGLGSLAWIALVPLLVSLEGRGPGAAFVLSYVGGLVFIIGSFSWILTVPGYNLVDEALLAFYLALYVAVWGLTVAWLRRRTALPLAVVAPILWVALEYVRSNLGFLSLPWMLLGHTQHLNIRLIQITSFTGVYGLTFLIVLVNAAVAETTLHFAGTSAALSREVVSGSRLPVGALACAAVLLVSTWFYGVTVAAPSQGRERITAALIRTNVARDHKWDTESRRRIVERNEELTRKAAEAAPQLIVWPETAVPGDVQHHLPLRQMVAQAARESKTSLLVGSSEYAKFTERRLVTGQYNSMYLFSPTGEIAGQYRKIVLVPFGEYEPMRGLVRWPKIIAASMGTHLPGNAYMVFNIGGVPFSAVICWEIIFPDLVRHFVLGGARFIVNASNEAWFPGSSMPEQMLAMSVFRAVENRTAVARSANLGISAIIDPFGRVTQRFSGSAPGAAPADGVLVGEIPLAGSGTFYTRHGDLFAFACVAASLLFFSSAWVPSAVRRLLAVRVAGRARRPSGMPSSASK